MGCEIDWAFRYGPYGADLPIDCENGPMSRDRHSEAVNLANREQLLYF